MTLREAIGQYIAWRRAQGARFQSQAYALRRYCRTGSRSEGVGATSARTLVSIGRATTITRCASARDGAQRRGWRCAVTAERETAGDETGALALIATTEVRWK